MVLFLVLVFSLLNRKRREGDLWILFLLLCGAGGVLAESLRYDKFLEYSFVRIQQVLAAIMLASGVALAGKRERIRRKGPYIIALVSMILTIAECIGLEFIIDRSEAVDSTIYSIFIGALTIPVIQGLTLMSTGKEENGEAGKTKLAAMTAAVTAISVTEVVSLLLEMGRIHYKDKFMLLALLPALTVMIMHCVAIRLAIRKNRPVIRSEE